MAFIDKIKERAKADKKTIVLPESMDKRTYEAAEKILKEGIANLIIIGTPEKLKWKLPVARLKISMTANSAPIMLSRSKFFIRITSRMLPAKPDYSGIQYGERGAALDAAVRRRKDGTIG